MKMFRWVFGLGEFKRKKYIYEHQEEGARHTVIACNREAADTAMRTFLQVQMFGGFALFYNPNSVEREFQKCKVINEPAEKEKP